MREIAPCSEYDGTNNKCRSGHVRLHPICRGISHGCKSCGAGDVPMCMMDDQPPHLIRKDGMPLLWPEPLKP
jgi:hypothetical protein